MVLLKTVFVYLLSMVIGFGFWYLIGWFISSESDLLLWPWYGKLFYLLFSYQSTNGVVDELSKHV
jgi:hypothetical protein